MAHCGVLWRTVELRSAVHSRGGVGKMSFFTNLAAPSFWSENCLMIVSPHPQK